MRSCRKEHSCRSVRIAFNTACEACRCLFEGTANTSNVRYVSWVELCQYCQVGDNLASVVKTAVEETMATALMVSRIYMWNDTCGSAPKIKNDVEALASCA